MDIIYIATIDGEKIPFEAVTTFNIEKSEYNYIIYRSMDKQKYYIAKYLGENIVDLNTDLTEEELKIGNTILEGVFL